MRASNGKSCIMTVFNIVFLGAGNVATHLAQALFKQGHRILQVYSRTQASAAALADLVQAAYTTDIKCLQSEADIYICALKDAVLAEVLAQVPDFGKALWLHTSGSMPLSVFEPYTCRCGVFYPLQTFSRQRAISFERIPFCLEANRKEDLVLMKTLASQLSEDVREMSSAQRQNLHVAAVFACNFTNSLYAMAQEILAYDHIDKDILQALIEETAAKLRGHDAKDVQTGPAVRMDRNVIDKHIAWLQAHGQSDKARLYEEMSRIIYERSQPS